MKMIIDDIKSANVQAMKDKDQRARGIYSVLMNKHLMAQVESRTNAKEVEDNEQGNHHKDHANAAALGGIKRCYRNKH